MILLGKMYCLVILLICSLLKADGGITDQLSDTELVDRIEAIVFGDDDTRVITTSDIDRPGIDGTKKTRDDIIFELLMYDDAKKYNIVPDEEKTDKYLLTVQKENNLTQEQLDQIFLSAGYTPAEGKKQFGIMYAVNGVIDFKVKSCCSVSEDEIYDYYTKHPQWEEATYYIKIGSVFGGPGESPAATAARCKQGKEKIEWSDPFWVEDSSLAESKQFIRAMDEGSIAGPFETGNGIEFYRLLKKNENKQVPLDQLRDAIIGKLRREKFERHFNKYKEELLDKAVIKIFD